METFYTSTVTLPRKTFMQCAFVGGIAGLVYGTAFLACQVFWSSVHHSFADRLGGAATSAVVFGLLQAIWWWWKNRHRDCTVMIHNDKIKSQITGSQQQQVRRDEIRNFRQTKSSLFSDSGLLLSNRGALGTFWLGGVFIPAKTPAFESIRRFVEQPETGTLELPAQ